MVQDDKQMYDEKNTSSPITVAPGAGTNLVTVEFTDGGKLEGLEVAAEEATWFYLIIRLTVAPNPVILVKPYRLNGDGMLILKEKFENPILTVPEGYGIVIQNAIAATAGKKYSASIKTWHRRE